MSTITQDFSAAKTITNDQAAEIFGDHDRAACGVGAVASLTGEAQHQVYRRALAGLAAVEHRGAESADGVSGDGAGILFEIPQDFFADYLHNVRSVGHAPSSRIGVGQIFLPKDAEAQATARQIVEDVLSARGITHFAWRDADVDSGVLGPISAATEPDTKQIVFECPHGASTDQNEKTLHEAMLEIEKRIGETGNPALKKFYICSLSSATIVYKAMVKPSRLVDYYRDLQMFMDKGLKTRIAEFHQRFATNAAPDWRLAHPYRKISHNGEVNTIASTARDAYARVASYVKKGQRAIQTWGSDTAQLDTIFHTLLVNGWTALQALKHLIPPALHPAQSQKFQDYVNFTQALSSQADGPAAIVCTHGDEFAAGLDRNGLRPLNCTTVDNEVLIVCSEAGCGLLPGDENKQMSRSLLRSGDAISVDLNTGEYLRPLAVEEHLAAAAPYAAWIKNIAPFNPSRIVAETPPPTSDRIDDALLAQLKTVGFTEEDNRDVVATLAETGKEIRSSMGNTQPPAGFSNLPFIHARLSNFFKQDFAQVTNPPLDSLRESDSFDMITRLGDRGDLVSAHPSKFDAESFSLLALASPLLTSAQFAELRSTMEGKGWKLHTIDASFVPGEWRDIESRLDALVAEAVAAVEQGSTQVVVSHQSLSDERAHIPSMLIVSAIDKALKERSLRHKANIHAEAGDVHDTHTLASVITSGADTVIPFLTEKLLTHNYAPTADAPNRLKDALELYVKGMISGLKKTMAKMGVATLNSYRGGHMHSALGLDRKLVQKYFGDVTSPLSGMTLEQLAYNIARNHNNSWVRDVSPLLHAGGRRSEIGGGKSIFIRKPRSGCWAKPSIPTKVGLTNFLPLPTMPMKSERKDTPHPKGVRSKCARRSFCAICSRLKMPKNPWRRMKFSRRRILFRNISPSRR